MTIQSNNFADCGTYSLELIGSLNPYLTQTFSFNIEVFLYPNTVAPNFHEILETPFIVILG